MLEQNTVEQIEFLSQFEEVNGYDFYRYLFPSNENKGELNDDFSKPNAIYLYSDQKDQESARTLRRRIMLKDTWEEDYMNYVEENPMTLCSGLSYRGRTNKLLHAHKMHALVFDLDGVGLKELRTLFGRFGGDPKDFWGRTYPRPTFVVSSGTGVHIYYVFREPIDLFPNIKLQLKQMKNQLTFKLWEYKSTSQFKAIQYQSINQGFRMVGSCNMKHGNTVRAFKVGEKVTIEELNRYVRPENQVDLQKRFKPSKMTLEEAKENFPQWYEDVIINKKRKKWDIAGKVNGDDPYALYHWWIKKAEQILGGHRYFFLMCCSIYASKCDVPKKKLRKDLREVFKILEKQDHENPLTEHDYTSALEAYDRGLNCFTIDDIERLTDIRIDKNKRNYRKQEMHLKGARAIQEINNPNWREGNGRPKGSGTKEDEVKEWQQNNPEGRKIDCHRDTGLDPKTIRKWWNEEVAEIGKKKECRKCNGLNAVRISKI